MGPNDVLRKVLSSFIEEEYFKEYICLVPFEYLIKISCIHMKSLPAYSGAFTIFVEILVLQFFCMS